MKSITSVLRGLSLAFCMVLLMVGSLFLTAEPAAAETHTINMGTSKGLVFDPPNLTVKAGDTVQFAIGNLPPHNVIFDDTKIPNKDKDLAGKLSHKGLEGAGKTFEVTFPKDAPAGTYSYFCLPHRGAGMVGKITVQ